MESKLESNELSSTLATNGSFWGMLLTQFLGAFNDNVYKQLVLLMAMPVTVVAASAAVDTTAVELPQQGTDMQGWATFVFSLPFVLFSGYAGYLSDRFSKTPIIVFSKVAEIVVMLLGLLAFIFYDQFGMYGTWTVLFLMATQSTFFGPGKYGILPELFSHKALTRANGLMVMTTFLAIIFGVVFAGKLYDQLVPKLEPPQATSFKYLWIGSLFCIGIAVIGILTSLMVRWRKPAQPDAKFTWDTLAISRDIYKLLARDRPLLLALLVSCVFWMVSSMAMPTVNRLGDGPLGLNKEQTGILVGLIAIGIMLGAPLGSFLLRFTTSRILVTIGLWGIVVFLIALSLWNGQQKPWLGDFGCRVALIGIGVSAAIYSIPLQVFLQERPPDELKGRMIATMNQGNFLGMMLSGPVYQLFERISDMLNIPINSVFFMIALLVIPLAIWYRLDDSPLHEKVDEPNLKTI
jgi:acyl-[acyl-carrier-protein]-phospholipid O-acyltransferase/long-chain-fatty-acid--[acyl-carrier-protein] ligase